MASAVLAVLLVQGSAPAGAQTTSDSAAAGPSGWSVTLSPGIRHAAAGESGAAMAVLVGVERSLTRNVGLTIEAGAVAVEGEESGCTTDGGERATCSDAYIQPSLAVGARAKGVGFLPEWVEAVVQTGVGGRARPSPFAELGAGIQFRTLGRLEVGVEIRSRYWLTGPSTPSQFLMFHLRHPLTRPR